LRHDDIRMQCLAIDLELDGAEHAAHVRPFLVCSQQPIVVAIDLGEIASATEMPGVRSSSSSTRLAPGVNGWPISPGWF